MNLSTAKQMIYEKVGVPLKFLSIGMRNQVEEFEGVITKCYSSTFLIVTTDSKIKSFSYNDFIIKNLKIIS